MLTNSKMNFLKILNYGFARRVIRSSIMTKQSELIEHENKQLEQQFEPLCKNSQVQQKIKSMVGQQLSYMGQDPSPHKLVNRPAKGVVWGLGGQLVMASKKVQLEGLKDDTDQILSFLELHQVKNIYVHDWKANGQTDVNRRRYAIIGSCFSARHCWKTGLEVKNAFNRNTLKINQRRGKKDIISASFNGNKDDEWSMISYKEFQVHLMTEQQRQAADLEWKWNNPVPQEVVERWSRLNADKKRRKNQFQGFD